MAHLLILKSSMLLSLLVIGYRKVNEEFFKSIIRAKNENARGLPPNTEVGSHC